MLTTTVDGLWVLQVLTGCEVVAPELGLRPHLPRVESKDLAHAHPMAVELRRAGALSDDGGVDDVIAEWLAVLARRELGLILYREQHDSGIGERQLLARFARWWVSLRRYGATVEISGAGTAETEESAASLIGSYLQRHWGVSDPADFRPLTLPADRLIDVVRRGGSPQDALSGLNLDNEQASMLTLAADRAQSTQASVTAVQSGGGSRAQGCAMGAGGVTVIDTPRGRVLAEHLTHDGSSWLLLGPGSHHSVIDAVVRMLRRLPPPETWHSYRKVV